MKYTAEQIAEILEGDVVGNPNEEVYKLSKIEVGTATTIDRGTFGSTIIRRGVKLDNQIQIAHNVEIGENTVIAGSTKNRRKLND